MNIVDLAITAKGKLTDSAGDTLAVDLYYGGDEWKLIDTAEQTEPLIYIDPIESAIPEKQTGFFREDYDFKFLMAEVLKLDSDKDEQKDVIWRMRAVALQFLRRMYEEENDEGGKLLMPFDGGRVVEVRGFLATNLYGVIVTCTMKERFPTETC